MVVNRDQVIRWLEEFLFVKRFSDVCPNGLQVFGKGNLSTIATCPSVSEEAFCLAKEAHAEMLLVHHGLFWDKDSRVIDPIMAKRLRILLQAEINLVAYHLPLDAHPTVGNNACLAKALALTKVDFSFGFYHGQAIGCLGELPETRTVLQLGEELNKLLGAEARLFGDLQRKVKRLGIVSGGAGENPFLLEAIAKGCDAYLTGSMGESGVAVAREGSLEIIEAGHYRTEQLGVRALGQLLAEQFDLSVVHLDVPNPV